MLGTRLCGNANVGVERGWRTCVHLFALALECQFCGHFVHGVAGFWSVSADPAVHRCAPGASVGAFVGAFVSTVGAFVGAVVGASVGACAEGHTQSTRADL